MARSRMPEIPLPPAPVLTRAPLPSSSIRRVRSSSLYSMWTVADVGHLMAVAADPGAYQEKVGRFLAGALKYNAGNAFAGAGGKVGA